MNRIARTKRKSGFTLVEILVYAALFGMIATTLLSLAYSSARENGSIVSDVIEAYEHE